MSETGEKRRLIVRCIAAVGLAIYVPLFLLVLLWPGLIAKAGKALLVREVNQRVQKMGGLASNVMEKSADLKQKFDALYAKNRDAAAKAAKLGEYVDANAERLVAAWVEARTKRQAKSKKLLKPQDEQSEFAAPADQQSQDAAHDEPSEEVDETTTGKSNGRLSTALAKARAKLERVKTNDDGSTASIFKALVARVALGKDGLLEHAITDEGNFLHRMERTIREKYNDILHELVREARVFTGSNVLIFTLLWLASNNRARIRRLFPLSLLLFAATMTVSYIYILDTNWILAIIHANYMGWAFLICVVLLTIYLGEGAVAHAFADPEAEASRTKEIANNE